MAAGSQLSIPTPLNYTTTTGQLPPSGRYMFINVLPESTVLAEFLWSPPYCIFCCTARRMTLQPCRGKQEEQGLTVSLWSLSRYKVPLWTSQYTLPKAVLRLQRNDFKVPFMGMPVFQEVQGCTSLRTLPSPIPGPQTSTRFFVGSTCGYFTNAIPLCAELKFTNETKESCILIQLFYSWTLLSHQEIQTICFISWITINL